MNRKPHITKGASVGVPFWVCRTPGLGYVGYGPTPAKAYESWVRLNVNVGKVGLA